MRPLCAGGRAGTSSFELDTGLCAITGVYWISYAICFDLRVPRPDAIGYFAYAQSLIIDGDLSLFDQLTRWGIDPVFVQQTALGHLNNFFACGAALLWLPFLTLLHLLLCASNSILGTTEATDGYSSLYLGTAAFASAVYGYLGLVLSYRAACRYVTQRTAAWATLTIALFSPLWFYVSVEGSMSHAASAFCAALFLYLLLPLWTETQPSTGRSTLHWSVLGSVGGVLSMVRWQDSLLPVCVGVVLLVDTARIALRRGRPARAHVLKQCAQLACYTGAFVVAFLPQMLIWQVQNGRPLAIPQGDQFFTPLRPAVFAVLFSASHSLFAWTPVVLIAVLGGASQLWSRHRRLAGLFVTLFVLQTYVNGIVIDPSAGASFGARRFLGLTPFFVVGLALSFTRLPRSVSCALVAMSGLWTAALWLVFVHGWIDPIRHVSFGDLLVAATRIAEFVPNDIGRLQPRRWHIGDGPRWLTLSLSLAASSIVACSTVVAFRLSAAPRLVGRMTAGLCGTSILLLVVGVAVAAERSTPMPIPGVRVGRHTVLNFGWYANTRFDGNPFTPQAHVLGAFDLPAQLQWGRTPFSLLPPTRDANAAPSSLTTCGLPLQRFSLALDPRPTRALHFALCGAGVIDRGAPVLHLRVETQEAGRLERSVLAGQDIWDFFAVPPAASTVHNSYASVSGYTLLLPEATSPKTVEISSPWSPTPAWPCAAVFAITQEFAPQEMTVGTEFRTVDLSPIANADYAHNAFLAAGPLNYYPDLTPGILEVDGVPFFILNRAAAPHDASALNAKQFGKRGVRLPLVTAPSEELALLVAVLDGDSSPHHIADFEVQYDEGPPTVRAVHSVEDVASYGDSAAQPRIAWQGSGLQKLSKVTIALEQRVPRYLWVRDLSDRLNEPGNRSVTVFAITQTTQR